MSTQQDINDFRAQRLANTHDPLALMVNTQTPFNPDQSSHITYIQHPQPNNNFVLQPSFNTNYMQQPMQNPEDISDPTTAFDMALELLSKAFQLKNTTTTNNNQRSSSNPCYSLIAQSGMNINQDRQMLMVDDNVGNQFRENAVQNVGHLYGNGNVVTAPAEGNGNGINGNPIRCYKCRGEGHYASNCTVKPRKLDVAYLQQQLQFAQEEEAGIQSTQEECEFMAAADAYEENERVKCGQSGETVVQHPATPEETCALFDSLYNNLVTEVEKVNSVNRKLKETNTDLTTELARYKNQEKCFEISQEKYDKLERCYQKSVYQEQCLTKKINALHLSSGKQITTLNEEISNLSKQLSTEKSTVSSLLEEKKKLKSDFKIREDELLDKQIQLENKIKELDNILVKTGQSIQTMHMLSPKPDSFYHTEQKMALGYQNPFYLKQAQRKQQSLYNGKVLLEKHDPPVVHDSEETLQLAQESRQKMKQLNKEIKPANYTKINHLSGIFVSQTAKSQEEV
ncbi:retrovirus-related pol polyprotein from transposon TNT 1-94 [Tanacetum coccineum]